MNGHYPEDPTPCPGVYPVTTTTRSVRQWPADIHGIRNRPSPVLGAAEVWGRMPMRIRLRGALAGTARLAN